MKKNLLYFLLAISFSAQAQFDFQSAYAQNPFVPKGLLEAVAWNTTRMVHLTTTTPSCSGIPQAYGIMGLHDDGKNYFLENGKLVATLSSISVAKQKENAAHQIHAYAIAFNALMLLEVGTAGDKNNPHAIRSVLHQLSEIPDSGSVNLLARDLQTSAVLLTMMDSNFALQHQFLPYSFDLAAVYGVENFEVLSGKKIRVSNLHIKGKGNSTYTPTSSNRSIQYPPALWNPADPSNFSSRNGVPVSAITIHTVQGSYAGAISWAQNPSANVSYHYVIRSSDGQVTQMVLEEDKAWHVGSENPYTIGYEHEGYVDNPVWYTNAMYNSSADLSRDIVNSGYGIPALRTYYGPATIGINTLGGCTKIKGHQHYPNQSHTDPGQYWDWQKYYHLINNAYSVNFIATTSGNLYDTGGPVGNYQDDEREFWLIQPANASSIHLQFNNFNVESGYDFLFIYDGDSTNAPLIGMYTGTNSPGTIQSTGGSLLLEFRSDCSTLESGWEASYTTVLADGTPPTTAIQAGNNWKTDDFTVTFVDQDNESGVFKRFYQFAVKSPAALDWQGIGSDGFLYESFEDNDSNWISVTGAYARLNNAYVFSDTAEQNSNAYALVAQNGGDDYLYEWEQRITSSAGNQRAGMHFMCDSPTSTNRGNSYFVYLRENDDKVQLYSVTNDVFTLETESSLVLHQNQSYFCQVMYSSVDGSIYVFVNDSLVLSWVDNTPLVSGNSISLRTGGCSTVFDNIKVYRGRNTNVNATVGIGEQFYLQSESAIPTGKIASRVMDSVLLWSNLTEETLLIDYTLPEIVTLNDGIGSDIDTTEINTLYSNWQAIDIHSDIAQAEVAIGTLPNLDNVFPWTGVGNAVDFSTLVPNLVYGQVYYTSVRITNHAGLENQFMSDGQRYIDNVGITETLLSSITVFPNPTSSTVQFKNLPENAKVEWYDMHGKLISVKQTNANFRVDSLANGTYRALIRYEGGLIVLPVQVAH